MSIEIKGHLMLEAFQAFADAIASLEGERDVAGATAPMDREYVGPVDDGEQDDIISSGYMCIDGLAEDAAEDATGAVGGGVYEPEFDSEDFPGRRTFNINEIDAEDPSFWSGRELGIPISLSIHYDNGQDRLFPIVNGMFSEQE